MDTSALQPLEGRWPNDIIPEPSGSDFQFAEKLFTTPRNQSVLQGLVQFDQTDSQALDAFAVANYFTYSQTSSYQAGSSPETTPGWLGTTINTTMPVFVHQMDGALFGYNVSFMLAYSTNSVQRDGQPTIHLDKRSIIRVSLPKVFPQVFLDSNKNDKGYLSTMASSFTDDQKLTLEGSFAQYFDLYAPKHMQANTLTLLAPNFMQILMSESATFDVEFFGTELYLISKDPLYTPTVMDTALRALEEQLQYMTRLLPSWNYQPLTPPFDLLHKTLFQGAVTKIGPLRIKPSAMLLLLLGGFILFGLLMILAKTL